LVRPLRYAARSKRYRIAGKFGGELNLAVWRIDQPTAKLKSANIKSFLYFARAKAIAHREVNWWVWSLGSLESLLLCANLSRLVFDLSLVQDNLSPMIGLQILKKYALIRSLLDRS
jgi:hypothetical protein